MTEKPETFFDQGQTSSPLQADVVFTGETNNEVPAEVKTEHTETTPAAEVKVETPVVTKKEPEGIFKNFDAPTTEIKKEEITPETKTDVKAEEKKEVEFKLPPEIQAELDWAKKVKENEAIKLLAGDKDLSEVDFDSLLKSAIPKDYSATSNEDLLRAELKAKYPTASNDEIEAGLLGAVEKFEGLSEAEQKLERRAMISKLEASQPENNLIKTLKALKDSQKQAPETDIQSQIDESFKAINDYFTTTSTTLIGQSYKGFVIEKAHVDTIPKALENDVKSFDKERSLMNYFKIVTYDDYGDAREKIGYEKAMKEKANPSQGETNQVLMTKDDEGLKQAKKEDFFEQANNN